MNHMIPLTIYISIVHATKLITSNAHDLLYVDTNKPVRDTT